MAKKKMIAKVTYNYKKEDAIIVNLSGRGDKDMDTILQLE